MRTGTHEMPSSGDAMTTNGPLAVGVNLAGTKVQAVVIDGGGGVIDGLPQLGGLVRAGIAAAEWARRTPRGD